MQEVGIAQVSKIAQSEKGKDMKYYTITKIAVIIMPSKISERAKKSKSLLNALTRIYRLAAIGITAVASWFATHSLFVTNYPKGATNLNNVTITNPTSPQGQSGVGGPAINPGQTLPTTSFHVGGIATIPFDILWPTIVAVSVIAIGIFIEIYLRKHKHSTIKENRER
jgi:hypothetical protein